MTSAHWRENRRSDRLGTLELREVFSTGDLIILFAERDLRLRYRQAFFGAAWAIGQPLLAAAVFSILLGVFAGIKAPGDAYFATAFVGFMGWTYISQSVSEAMESLTSAPALVTKVYFPRLVAPTAALLPAFADFVVCLPVLALVIALSPVSVGPGLVALPVCMLLLFFVAFGVGIWLAALNVRYRDVRFAFGFALQMWFFVSPVAYALSLVPSRWQLLYSVNPAAGVLSLLRWSLIDGVVNWWGLAISCASTALIVLTGLAYFAATERTFADRI